MTAPPPDEKEKKAKQTEDGAEKCCLAACLVGLCAALCVLCVAMTKDKDKK